MQGSGNIVRTYKQKNKSDVRYDPKRDKNSNKSLIRKDRRSKSKEIEE